MGTRYFHIITDKITRYGVIGTKIRSINKQLSDFIHKNLRYILIFYFLASTLIFCLQFFYFQSWDMVVRILNGNYLLHNGYYFENFRAILESFIIGLLAFVMGNYAVYGFILLSNVIFFYAIYRITKLTGIDMFISVSLCMNFFLLAYGMMNGAELITFSFLILFVSSIYKRDVLAGFFLALAFLSKYYAILFAPLLLFLFVNKQHAKNTILFIKNAVIFIVTLIPYFFFNYIRYGNFIYGFAVAYLSFGITIARGFYWATHFILNGLIELVIPAGLIIVGYAIYRNKFLKKTLNKRNSVLFGGLVLAFFIYYRAYGLVSNSDATFRFFLLTLIFSILILSATFTRRDYFWIFCFALVSLLISACIIFSAVSPTNGNLIAMSQLSGASVPFSSIYGTMNCTVYSNEWVYLDYYGIPAAPLPYNVNNISEPIISYFPMSNISLPLRYSYGNVYIYGKNSCSFYKVNIDYFILKNQYLASINQTTLPFEPCTWISFNSTIIQNTCNYVNSLFGNV